MSQIVTIHNKEFVDQPTASFTEESCYKKAAGLESVPSDEN